MVNSLWTVPQQGSGKIIRATAALAGVPLEQPAYEHFVDNKKPEFLSKFPHGKIPAFEGGDGFKLFEGVAIARYVASLAPNAGLLGKNTQEDVVIDQWIHLADSELDIYNTLIYQLLNGHLTPYNKPIHTTFVERQRRTLKTLNDHLASRTYFVGERITLADIFIATTVGRTAGISFDAAARTEFPHLTRHLESIIYQPQLKEILGTVKFVEKALEYVPPAKEN